MIYHIVWPHDGDASDLSENIKRHLTFYYACTDRYDDLSAKDQERIRRATEGSTDYNLTAKSPILNWNAIFKNRHNKGSVLTQSVS